LNITKETLQMNRMKFLVYVLAVAGLLALSEVPSYAAFGRAAATNGGPQFLSTSLPRQARGNGVTETMGEVVLSVTGAATVYVPDNSSIDILFSAPITNNPVTVGPGGNVLCNNAGCPASMTVILFPPVNPTGLRIQFTNPADANAATSIGPGDTITIAAVRTNASTILTDGSSITATMSGVSATPTTNPITFTDPVRTVATLVNPETTVTFFGPAPNVNLAAINIATCNPGNPFISTTLTERYPAALTTQVQEAAFSSTPAPANGTQVVVVITGVPAGVTVTAASPVLTTTGGGLLNLVVVAPAIVVSTGAAITYTYTVTASNTALVETVTPSFALTTIGIVGTPQTVQMQDRIGPIGGNTTVRFINNSQAGPTTVATIADCVTRFIWPWVLAGGATGYDTGIAIANSTEDDLAFGAGAALGATAQAGTCQLTGYNSSTGATVAATTASIAAGRTAAFLASGLTGWSGFSGYVLGVCNFTNAHAFTFVVNGFGTLAGPNLAEGYLTPVVPAGSRAVVPAALTEILGF
jgi:hypothetical protein